MRAAFIRAVVVVSVAVAACSGSDQTDGKLTFGPTDNPEGSGGAGGVSGASSSGASSSAGAGGGNVSPATSGASTSTGAGGGSQGCASIGETISQPDEICGNGRDENGNGFFDEGCTCAAGATQPCYPGTLDNCACMVGVQTCIERGEIRYWGTCVVPHQACHGQLDSTCEICDNNEDDDCDGQVDENCDADDEIDVDVDLNGDCLTVSCPPQAPYPVGCDIDMHGNDPKGCVANAPGSSVVYFQEGDACGAGKVTGTLRCSSKPGPELNQFNCHINKSKPFYEHDRHDCPETN